MSIPRFVELTFTNPAKLLGLYPRKGTIAIGADADIVIWNPDITVVVNNDILHHNFAYTPYEGMELKGWPETIISRGRQLA